MIDDGQEPRIKSGMEEDAKRLLTKRVGVQNI